MSTATRQRPSAPALSELVEAYALEGGGKLRIDKENAVIYGCKVGGRFSKNNHGIPGVTRGAEYTRSAYEGARDIYEGVKVYPKHAKERGPFDYLGIIRNLHWDAQGDCPRADFHYRKTHEDTPKLLEDVERGLGGFGFSHHIPQGGYTGKVVNGRLIVESITAIKSVDLVADPATTRNLWESQERPAMEMSFKTILESFVADKSEARKAIARDLIENNAELVIDVTDVADPLDQVWLAVRARGIAIFESNEPIARKVEQLGACLYGYDKLTAEAEPTTGETTPGHLRESKEIQELKAKNACYEAGILKPSAMLVKALSLMDNDAERKALIEQTKAATDTRRPVSSAPRRPNHQPSTAETVPTGEAARRRWMR